MGDANQGFPGWRFEESRVIGEHGQAVELAQLLGSPERLGGQGEGPGAAVGSGDAAGAHETGSELTPSLPAAG